SYVNKYQELFLLLQQSDLPFLLLLSDASLLSAYCLQHAATAYRDSYRYFPVHASHLKSPMEILMDMHNANGSIPNLLHQPGDVRGPATFSFYKYQDHSK